MRKSVCKKFIVLFAALCVLVAFACVSVSKFVLSDRKELTGVYTDFVLSHDGEGQTAVIRKEADGSCTGYVVVSVNNFDADKVSKRDVRFSLRAPTSEELNRTYVTDAWGVQHGLNADSGNYEVSIVDENDNPLTNTSEATLLHSAQRNTSSLLLKIRRKANAAPAMPSEGTERLSVILQTSEPYIDLQVFTVNTTMARLSVGVSSDVYNGFTREIVNLKSASEFIRGTDTPATDKSYLAEVEFTLSGDVVFDTAKYKETYGDEVVVSAYGDKYTVTVRAGADVNLYFYARGGCSVKASATIYDGKTAPGEERVSGVNDDKVVFERV